MAPWSIGLLAISLALFAALVVWPAANTATDGFAAYYTAARLVLEGRAGPVLYDDAGFRAEVERQSGGRASDIYWANPPTTALLLLPLAGLPPVLARQIWIGLMTAALAAAVALLYEGPGWTRLRSTAFCVVTAVCLLSAPVADNFKYGQAYIPALALLSSALFALRRRADPAAGACLGLALVLKASGLPLWLILAAHGRWRTLGWAAVTAALAILLSLPLVGTAAWWTFLTVAAPGLLRDPVISVPAYQTLPGILRHLLVFDAVWNTAPIVDWPALAALAAPVLAGALIAAGGVSARRASADRAVAVGLILSVILVPVAEQYAYVLVLPAFLAAVFEEARPRWLIWLAALLIVLPLPYNARELGIGWWAVLAYPRLYGALLLYGALVWPGLAERLRFVRARFASHFVSRSEPRPSAVGSHEGP